MTAEYLTEIQAFELVSGLEKKRNLFQVQIEGHSAWRLVRSKVLYKLQQFPFADQRPTYLKLEWLAERVIFFVPDLFSLLTLRKSKFFIKTYSSALSDDVNGYYKDMYFDYIFQNDDSCLKIETLNNPSFAHRRKRAFRPASLTTAAIDLVSSLCALVFYSNECSKIAKEIVQVLHEHPAYREIRTAELRLTLTRFVWLKRIYKYLLRRVRPIYVLVADSDELALLAAAQDLGINSLEFQHGVFVKEHPDSLPKLDMANRNSLVMPGKLLLYGEYWKDQLRDTEFEDNELVVVGNPRIDHYRQVRTERLKTWQSGGVRVVVTTQGVDREKLITYLFEFIEAANKIINVSLFIKMHPVSDRDRNPYERAFKGISNVKILSGSELPSTFELLVDSDYHASIASAAHYDALGLGVPTIIMPFAGHELLMPLVDLGHARLASTPQEMLNIVMAKEIPSLSNETRAYYYLPDSVQAIRKCLGINVTN